MVLPQKGLADLGVSGYQIEQPLRGKEGIAPDQIVAGTKAVTVLGKFHFKDRFQNFDQSCLHHTVTDGRPVRPEDRTKGRSTFEPGLGISTRRIA
jgi:hypothetical protein